MKTTKSIQLNKREKEILKLSLDVLEEMMCEYKLSIKAKETDKQETLSDIKELKNKLFS